MRKRNVIIIVIIAIFVLMGLATMYAYNRFVAPTTSTIPETRLDEAKQREITTVAQDLDTPWTITVLPDDRLLVSERQGTLRILGQDGQRFEIADVVETSEGGLLGVALDPDFETNDYLYIYKTTGPTNLVERYRLQNNLLTDRTAILTGIPAASNHNGGAIAFGPDEKLYITTGDASQQDLAQDRGSLAGKILRLDPDGSIPADNPFDSAVYSYGHRNPQGLAWDDDDRLWATEHGPSGAQSGFDELNLIKKGGNYGWPVIRGDETREGMITPVANSGADDTWAPAGLAYADDNLFFAGLRGQTLYRASITGERVTLTRHLAGTYGRLRAVTVQDDVLLVSTSNYDGRGQPRDGDDKILRVPLNLVQ